MRKGNERRCNIGVFGLRREFGMGTELGMADDTRCLGFYLSFVELK
jgi:hypothetical protein